MTSPATDLANGFRVVETPHWIPGAIYGAAPYSLRLHLEWSGPPSCLNRFREKMPDLWNLDRTMKAPREISGANPTLQAGTWLLDWTREIQRVSGLPVLGQGQVLTPTGRDGAAVNSILLLIPASPFTPVAAWETFQGVLAFFQATVNQLSGTEARSQLKGLMERLRSLPPKASDTTRFIRVAHEKGIPITWITAEVMQYGYGARSRWIDSSIFQDTSAIGVSLARFKQLGAQALETAGLPTTKPELLRDADHAVRRATELGYPVVIKPANLAGGGGVFLGLQNTEAVRRAFDQAKQLSPLVVIEKQVPGRDYRLLVFRGKVIKAVERIPGGVTGDGVSSVATLLERLNGDPDRAPTPNAPLKPIALDDEAKGLLAENGLSFDSVPNEGTFVRLRRTANHARGGLVANVIDQVHQDNTTLAVRAANALRLDPAGVDLLIPDIRVSWLKGEAAICEVNAQPTIGHMIDPQLYERILDTLLNGGDGRIPIVVVSGSLPNIGFLPAIRKALETFGLRVGWQSNDGVMLDHERLTPGNVDPYDAGHALLRDPRTDAIVLSIPDPSVIMKRGLPFDRYDILVAGGPQDDNETPQSHPRPKHTSDQEALAPLLPACSRLLIPCTETIAGAIQALSVSVPIAPIPSSTDDLIQMITRALRPT